MASGLLGIVAALGLMFAGACSSVGAPATAPERAPGDPAITQGELSPSQAATAARLLREMNLSLSSGDPEAARDQAGRVIAEFSAAQGASRAYWVLAQAEEALENLEGAYGAATSFLDFLAPPDPRSNGVRLFMGRVRIAQGEPEEGVLILLAIGDGEATSDEALTLIEGAAEFLTPSALDELANAFSPPTPLTSPILAELALTRFLVGDEVEARALAEQVLTLGARDRALELAEAVLVGDLGDFAVEPAFGMILPVSGSPTLRTFAQLIQEGVQVALSEADRPGLSRQSIDLILLDNRGNPLASGPLVAELEAQQVMAILGPLQQASLAEAVSGRLGRTPIISPTSPVVPVGQSDVYSLGGVDPGAAHALARYAIEAGFATAVTLFPEVEESRIEAEAFREVFTEAGGTVLDELAYAPGTTFWEAQLRRIETLLPDVVVLPVPAQDVELLAPQVTFFGIDSLGINVLGTTAWSQPDVLQKIDPRHTNGVIAAARQQPGVVFEGQERFRIAYEALHQRSLRSPIPALGYDATNILIEGIRRGARSPAQLATALEDLDGYLGATGRLSIQEGRVLREHFVVCTQDRVQLPVPSRARPLPLLLPPLPDSTGEIPEDAPDRIVGFACPTVSPPLFVDSLGVDSLGVDTLRIGPQPTDTIPAVTVRPIRLGQEFPSLIDSLGGR